MYFFFIFLLDYSKIGINYICLRGVSKTKSIIQQVPELKNKKLYQTQMADKSNIAIISVSQADIIPSISKNAAQNFFCYFSNDLAELHLLKNSSH